MTRKSIMDEIRKVNEVHTIQILGSEKDKEDAFYILMNTQQLISDKKEVFHAIKNSTIELLEKAEIEFKVLDASRENHEDNQGASTRKDEEEDMSQVTKEMLNRAVGDIPSIQHPDDPELEQDAPNSQDTAVQVGKRVREPLPDKSTKTIRRKNGGSVRRR